MTKKPASAEAQLKTFIAEFDFFVIGYWSASPDPKKLLLGSGNQTRFVRLESAKQLADPDVEALVAEAVARAKTPLAASGRGKLIIRSISAKQHPRRRPVN